MAPCHVTALSDDPSWQPTVTVIKASRISEGMILSWDTPAPNALHDVMQLRAGDMQNSGARRPDTLEQFLDVAS